MAPPHLGVLGDDGLDVAGHVLEVGYLYILVDGMEVGHADAEGDGVGALHAEDVRVGPAAGGGVAGLKAASGRSGLQMRDDGVAGLVHDSRVVQLPGHFHLAAEAGGGFFQGAGHDIALGEHAILV